MRSEQKPSIRLTGVSDASLIPNPRIPDHVRNNTEGGLAVFELRGHRGVTNYITIPVLLEDEEHIAHARAILHEMLESLSEQTRMWKQPPQGGGGTP
jgi:hypothetical protein